MECISAHPQVGGYGELLLDGVEGWSDWPKGARDRPFYTTYLKDRGAQGSHLRRHSMMFRYLDYLYEDRRGLGAIGFKLMYNQAWRHPEVVPYLRLHGVRVIHLFRENVLDIHLSREALLLRTVAHARSEEERERIRVRLDVGRLARELRRLRREQQVARLAVRACGLATHEVFYEQALADDAVLHRTLAFLGINSSADVDLSPTMLKLAPPSHRESIENFEEVAATLADTPFAGLLKE